MCLSCTCFLYILLYMYIDTNDWLVVRAWAWLHDCIWQFLGVYRCACCVYLCISGFLLAACMVGTCFLYIISHVYIDTNTWLVVRAWAWICDCIWQVLGGYRCACYWVCLWIYGFLLATCMCLLYTCLLYIIIYMYIDTVIGWLCAPGRGYITVYERFSVFAGVFVIVYACVFMDFS